MTIVNLVKKYLIHITIALIIFLGLFIRLYKIDFGLPYSFMADEMDIYDAVIKYSLNYKFIIAKGDFEEFFPNSYVYGMFPTYFLTFSTMVLNKLSSIFKFSIDFNFYLVYMRIITAFISSLIILLAGLISKSFSKNSKAILLTLFLVALNWRLIIHSHYLNQDTYLTVLLLGSIFFFIRYITLEKGSRTNLILSSVLFGLATGTKITALVSIPLIFLIFFLKKDFKSSLLFITGTILAFALSNPFSLINYSSFLTRLSYMKGKEAGIVFSSVDNNPFKYVVSLSEVLTIPVLILSILGISLVLKKIYLSKYWKEKGKEKDKEMGKEFLTHTLLIGNILIYVLFFSLNPRRVDRWLLPIIPILCIYASFAVFSIGEMIRNLKYKYIFVSLSLLSVLSFYIPYTISLFKEFQHGKPRVSAYLWTKEYLKQFPDKKVKMLVYTNEGRDPFVSIKGSEVNKFQVYEANKAYEIFPRDPLAYDIIVVHSGLKKNYENEYVISKYPSYYNAWVNFENSLRNTNDFNLIAEFNASTKLNLMGMSDIFIYQRVK